MPHYTSSSSWLFSSVERWGDYSSEVEYWSAVHVCCCFLSTVSLLVFWWWGHHTGLCIQRREQTTETLTLQTLPHSSILFQILESKDSATKLMFTSAMCVGNNWVSHSILKLSLKIKSLRDIPVISFFSSVHENRPQHNVCFEINPQQHCKAVNP